VRDQEARFKVVTSIGLAVFVARRQAHDQHPYVHHEALSASRLVPEFAFAVVSDTEYHVAPDDLGQAKHGYSEGYASAVRWKVDLIPAWICRSISRRPSR
jgi:hypothetical protein